MRKEELDQVAAFVSELKKQYKCVRFYSDYFKFLPQRWVHSAVPCRSASHLIKHATRWLHPVPLRVRLATPGRSRYELA